MSSSTKARRCVISFARAWSGALLLACVAPAVCCSAVFRWRWVRSALFWAEVAWMSSATIWANGFPVWPLCRCGLSCWACVCWVLAVGTVGGPFAPCGASFVCASWCNPGGSARGAKGFSASCAACCACCNGRHGDLTACGGGVCGPWQLLRGVVRACRRRCRLRAFFVRPLRSILPYLHGVVLAPFAVVR